jgi:hypothetical protein
MRAHSHGRGLRDRQNVSLRDQIDECMNEDPISHKIWMPEDCMRQVITQKIICDKLGLRKKDEDLINYICSSARKTFLILTWMGKKKRIKNFFGHNFTDDHLPIEAQRVHDGASLPRDDSGSDDIPISDNEKDIDHADDGINRKADPKISSLNRRQNVDETFDRALNVFREDEWHEDGMGEITDFCTRQWSFLAAVLTGDQPMDIKFPSKTPLPIVELAKTGEQGGGCSKVFCVKIHRMHLDQLVWHSRI